MNPAKRTDVLLPSLTDAALLGDESAVSDLLSRDPKVGAELTWMRELGCTLREAEPSPPSADYGFSRLAARIEKTRAPRVSLLQRVAEWIAPVWRPALIGACALVLVQSAVIGLFVTQPDAVYRTLALDRNAGKKTLVQITFHPKAKAEEIRALLAKIDAEIVSGPGALGVYTVRSSFEREKVTQILLAEAKIVESVLEP